MAALISLSKDHTMPEFCTNCGAPLSGPFCGRCGHRAQSASAPPQPSPTPQPVVTPTSQPISPPTAQPIAPSQTAAPPQPSFQQPTSSQSPITAQPQPSFQQPTSQPPLTQPPITAQPAAPTPPLPTMQSSASAPHFAEQSAARQPASAPQPSITPAKSSGGGKALLIVGGIVLVSRSLRVRRGALWRSLGQAQSIFY